MGDFDIARFRAILDQAGMAGPVGQTSRSLMFRCFQPDCGKAKLAVLKDSGHFVCWRCRYINQMEGRPEHLLSRWLGIRIDDAKARLYGGEAPAITSLVFNFFDEEADYEQDEQILLPEQRWDYHHLPISDPKAERGRAYLESRGIPGAVADEYLLRYSPPERRVYFPVYVDRRLVGWQGRLVVPDVWIDEDGGQRSVPKILSSKEIPRDEVLMFQDRVTARHAVLAEGPIDALKLHLCGGNVAAMGKTVTPGQIGVLKKKRVQRLYLGLDPDALDETMRIVRAIGSDMKVFMLEIPSGFKDLGEMSMEAVREVFRAAKEIHPWQLHFYFFKGAI